MTVDEEWPALLRDYEAALAVFENASRALTAALVERHPADYRFVDFVVAEEKARDSVIVARMRLIESWRDSVLAADNSDVG